VNYQILLYLVSRVLIALVKLWSQKEMDPYTKHITFKQACVRMACVCAGVVRVCGWCACVRMVCVRSCVSARPLLQQPCVAAD
jgi:hypothetical protein